MRTIASPTMLERPEPTAATARRSASSGLLSRDRAPLQRSELQRQIDESPRMAAQRRMLDAVSGARGREQALRKEEPAPLQLINDHPHPERAANVVGVRAAQLLKAPTEKTLRPGKGGPAVAQLMLGEGPVDEEDPERNGGQHGQGHDHEQGDDTVSTFGRMSGYLLPTRWYSWDGRSTYTPRTIGLPALSGWLNINATRKNKPIYMSFEDFARWKPVQAVQEIAAEVQALAERIPLLQGAVRNVRDIAQDAQVVQQRLLTENAALGEYLNRASTPTKVILSVLGLVAAIATGGLLNYLDLPTWVVALVDGLSVVYSLYVLYRWSSSKLLPPAIKIALLATNSAAILYSAPPVLADLGAYYLGLTESFPFQHITLAALPFALCIEQLIAKALERVNLVRQRFNERNGHPNEGHLE